MNVNFNFHFHFLDTKQDIEQTPATAQGVRGFRDCSQGLGREEEEKKR